MVIGILNFDHFKSSVDKAVDVDIAGGAGSGGFNGIVQEIAEQADKVVVRDAGIWKHRFYKELKSDLAPLRLLLFLMKNGIDDGRGAKILLTDLGQFTH